MRPTIDRPEPRAATAARLRASQRKQAGAEAPVAGAVGGVQALETGLSVLDAMLDATQPMMLKDIAVRAAMHPAKAHRYLASFVKCGYVEQHADGRYSLGRNALRLGMACLAQLDPLRLVTPVLDALCAETGETVLAAVWGDHGPTVVQWRDSARPVTVNVRPGSVMPLLSSATGRVFAAFLDPALTAPLIEAELRTRTRMKPPRYPRNAAEVAAMREAVGESRIGYVNGDLLPGVDSVSTPVFDRDGRIVLAITALGNAASFDARIDGPVARAIRRAAEALSQRLGFGGKPFIS